MCFVICHWACKSDGDFVCSMTIFCTRFTVTMRNDIVAVNNEFEIMWGEDLHLVCVR